jgi:hypothetical protein
LRAGMQPDLSTRLHRIYRSTFRSFGAPCSHVHVPVPMRPLCDPFESKERSHSFEQTPAMFPCGNNDRPRLVSLTLVSFVLRRSRRLFFRVIRHQPVPFDRYPFGPFGGRATSLAAVTPRTLSSQSPRSLAPHDAGARENCARSSSAYCHREAWLVLSPDEPPCSSF